MAGETGDVERFEAPHRQGWLGAKQQAWETAPGTPPRGPAQPHAGGFYGGKKFSLLFAASVLAGLAAFGGFVAYNEATTEHHEHFERGPEAPTSGNAGEGTSAE